MNTGDEITPKTSADIPVIEVTDLKGRKFGNREVLRGMFLSRCSRGRR